MSSSRYASEAPHRSSNFALTCNLLSQYVKEKGSLKNLNIEIGGKVESLEDIVKPGSSSSSPPAIRNKKTNEKAKSAQQSSAAQPQRKPAQLTIFYSGKVLVFDDYPVDKARELVSIAKRSSSQMSYGILSTAAHEKHYHTTREAQRLPPRPQLVGGGISSNTCKEKSDLTTGTAAAEASSRDKQPAVLPSKEKPNSAATAGAPEQLSPQSDASGSDLPIARRSSIHRFLEKRKDRALGRIPYQNYEQAAAAAGGSSSSKGDAGIDLNL